MNATMGAGAALSAVGLCGYVVGLWVTYPGRAFSVTLLMAGVTLAAIGRSNGLNPEGSA